MDAYSSVQVPLLFVHTRQERTTVNMGNGIAGLSLQRVGTDNHIPISQH